MVKGLLSQEHDNWTTIYLRWSFKLHVQFELWNSASILESWRSTSKSIYQWKTVKWGFDFDIVTELSNCHTIPGYRLYRSLYTGCGFEVQVKYPIDFLRVKEYYEDYIPHNNGFMCFHFPDWGWFVGRKLKFPQCRWNIVKRNRTWYGALWGSNGGLDHIIFPCVQRP